MKWSFVIKEKLKAAALMFGIMVAIIIGMLVSSYNTKEIDQSVSSIYQDRLLPATTIIYLTDNLYRKRLDLEDFLRLNSIETKNIRSSISQQNNAIDSLLTSFEKTYLVDREIKGLRDLRKSLAKYATIEDQIISLTKDGLINEGITLFDGTGKKIFHSSISSLIELSSIQTKVGKELVGDSKRGIASLDSIQVVLIVIATVIGAGVLILIQNSKIVEKKKQQTQKGYDFDLN